MLEPPPGARCENGGHSAHADACALVAGSGRALQRARRLAAAIHPSCSERYLFAGARWAVLCRLGAPVASGLPDRSGERPAVGRSHAALALAVRADPAVPPPVQPWLVFLGAGFLCAVAQGVAHRLSGEASTVEQVMAVVATLPDGGTGTLSASSIPNALVAASIPLP